MENIASQTPLTTAATWLNWIIVRTTVRLTLIGHKDSCLSIHIPFISRPTSCNMFILSDDITAAISLAGQFFHLRLSRNEMLCALCHGRRTGRTNTLPNLCRWRRGFLMRRGTGSAITTCGAGSTALLSGVCPIVEKELHLRVSTQI